MPNPVASQTFDFVRVYLCERTGGAPGSGTWATTSQIFDGNSTPLTVPQCTTFSAGAKDSLDRMGIVGDNGSGALAFIGEGSPAVPYLITYPGESGSPIQSADYWELAQGAFYVGGAYFLPHFTGDGILRIITSTTGLDGSWTECDSGNAPTSGDGELLAMQRVDDVLYFFISLDGSGTDWSILPFNMATGLYEAPFAPLSISLDNFGSDPNNDSWGNGLFKFPDGGFMVLYAVSNAMFAQIWDTVSWGSPISIPGQSLGNALMDEAFSGVHAMNYHSNSAGENSAIDYNFIAYPSGTVTSILNAIPAISNGADGVGHSTVLDGVLIVPRDDSDDFANSVWVAEVPVVTFSKEILPVPPGEAGTITSKSINTQGQGFAVNDTGTINGGLSGYLAKYRVNSIFNGIINTYAVNNGGSGYSPGDVIFVDAPFTDQASGSVTTVGGGGAVTGITLDVPGVGYPVSSGVTTTTFGLGSGLTIDINSVLNGVVHVLILTDTGGGYSVASNVGTTTGGAQPGVGTGLTINILTVAGKSPSCSYMVFPNGYSLTASISIACPIAPLTATVGVPYVSDAPIVSGDTPPDTFELASGPSWMLIDANTGVVYGTPDVAGSVDYEITVTDSLGNTATVAAPCPLTVSAPAAGSPCENIIPQPATDVQFKLIKVMATMLPAKRLPVRGSVQ